MNHSRKKRRYSLEQIPLPPLLTGMGNPMLAAIKSSGGGAIADQLKDLTDQRDAAVGTLNEINTEYLGRMQALSNVGVDEYVIGYREGWNNGLDQGKKHGKITGMFDGFSKTISKDKYFLFDKTKPYSMVSGESKPSLLAQLDDPRYAKLQNGHYTNKDGSVKDVFKVGGKGGTTVLEIDNDITVIDKVGVMANIKNDKVLPGRKLGATVEKIDRTLDQLFGRIYEQPPKPELKLPKTTSAQNRAESRMVRIRNGEFFDTTDRIGDVDSPVKIKTPSSRKTRKAQAKRLQRPLPQLPQPDFTINNADLDAFLGTL